MHEGDALPELSYDVTATTVVLGALATRDWRPMHHDHDFAVNRNGTQDIFLNTPNQAAWFERYVTDWTGPKGRLGRMKFRMKGSVFPGDTMVMRATVEAVETDDAGCGWAIAARDALGRRRASRPTARSASRSRPEPTTTPGPAAATTGDRDPAPCDRRGSDLMDLEFTEEQEMLREMVRGVCSSYAPLETVRAVEDDPVGYPLELWKQLGALDLIGLMIPTEYGGSGMTPARRRGRLRGARPRARAVAALRERGDERGRAAARRLRRAAARSGCPRIVAGDAILTPAWLEPHHGFGPRGVQLDRPRRRRRASCSTA